MEWVLQHRQCYVRSCLWGWGGVGWGGVGFATQTVLCAVLSVGLGWGGVEWVLQHRPCYVQSCLGGWDGVGWGGVCNKDCYKPLCLWGWGGVGFATQTVLCPGPIRLFLVAASAQ